MCCPNPKHAKGQRATNFIVRFGRKIYKRFNSYERANRFLTGLRFKVDEGTFDGRDYQPENPLGFSNLVEKYFIVKSRTIKASSLGKVRCDLRKAQAWFEDQSVKEIQYGQIEDFLLGLEGISGKTRNNIKVNLHAFFAWLCKRREIKKDQMPDFPDIPYQLGWRKTIDVDTRDRILEEVARISSKNPRIYMAILWLCTYINMRPSEPLGILEEDVDYERGIVIIREHKTSRQVQEQKIITLLPEDLAYLRTLPRGFPKMHLFRRDHGGGGKFQGTPFGKYLLWATWKKACPNLGIKGVDLHGGTRHSSAQGLRPRLTPEAIKRLMGTHTNKAFERYFVCSVEELRAGYAMTRTPEKSAAAVLELPDHRRTTKK